MKLSEMSQGEKKKNVDTHDDIYGEFEKLKNCSADELMSRLAEEIAQQKARGTFDFDAISNAIEQVKIYLPSQTYENMRRIINELK